MALVLRSNNRALNHLGEVNGFTGPSDYVAMLDFAGGSYFRMSGGSRVDMTIGEAINFTRASPGVVRRPDMSLYTVPPNTPRISYNSAHGMSGLLIESALTNIITAPVNGSSVSVPASSGFVVLSFNGGDASLSHANLTLVESYVAEGRTCKRYSRSSSSAFAATLSVAGASNIQAVVRANGEGYYPGNFLGYGGTQDADLAVLSPALVSLIAGGDYTIVMQVLMNAAGGNSLSYVEPIRVVSASPYGGAMVRSSRSTTSNGTDTASTAIDGAAATVAGATVRATLSGTWNDNAVFGLACQNNGDSVGIMSYGQYNKETALGAQSGPPSTVYLGGGARLLRIGGAITRVAIYDRMLTDDEAWGVANAWR